MKPPAARGSNRIVDRKRSFFVYFSGGLFLIAMGLLSNLSLLAYLGGFVAFTVLIANLLDVPFKLKEFEEKKREIEELDKALLDFLCESGKESKVARRLLQELKVEKEKIVSNYKWSISFWVASFIMVLFWLASQAVGITFDMRISANHTVNNLVVYLIVITTILNRNA